MQAETISNPRRVFVISAITGALAVLLNCRLAHAIAKRPPPGVPAIDPEDAQAKALHYVADVTDVDSNTLKLNPTPAEAGQRCSTCQLYSGTPGAEWGPCAIFSYRIDPATRKNYVVSADGWCRSWAARAA